MPSTTIPLQPLPAPLSRHTLLLNMTFAPTATFLRKWKASAPTGLGNGVGMPMEGRGQTFVGQFAADLGFKPGRITRVE